MNYEVTVSGRTRSIEVREHPDGGWRVRVDDGPERRVRGGRLGSAEWLVQGDAGDRTVGLVPDGDRVHLQIGGHPLEVRVVDPRQDALALGAAVAPGALTTEMPGAVVRILVAEGDQVAIGDPVIVVEAMKMENELVAPAAGVVSVLHVASGDRVESGALLVTIDPSEA